MYISSNAKRVENKQELTFQLVSQSGKQTEFKLTPEFLESGNPHSIRGVLMLAKVDHKPLPEGVEFVFDYTCVRDEKLGVVVHGNVNELQVSFDGECFPLFSLEAHEADQTVPGSHGRLYFKGLPVEFGGGPILSWEAYPNHGLE